MHRYAILALGLWASWSYAEPYAHSTHVEYQSVFENKHRYSDPALDDWKVLNQTVNEIGGWRTYMRETMQGSMRSTPHSSHSMHSNHGGEQ